jgi:uncharacterized protein
MKPWLCVMLWLATQALAAPSCPPAVAGMSVAAPQPAKDHGLLWRISRDGHSSYLFGTVHVGKPAWRHFGPQLTAALQETDVLALEVDPSDPALAEGLVAAAPSVVLPPDLQERLAQAFARACVSAEVLANLHPLLQATTLGVLEARWLGLDPAFALEHLLLAQATARGRPVVALESAAQQVAALVPADPAEAQTMLAQSLAQLEERGGQRVLRRLARAWERGDLNTLENYGAWCECANSADERGFMRRLNDERNPALADGISALHAQGRRVLAAVGALHMTGPQSLPRLLALRGFKVARVGFAPSSSGASRRTIKSTTKETQDGQRE